jgi:hypothetical protein
MKEQSNMKHTVRFFIIIMLLSAIAASSMADDLAPVSLACDGAAPSHLSAGNTARQVQVFEPFAFSQNTGEALLDVLLDDITENVLLTNTHSVFGEPALAPVLAYNIAADSEVSILGEMQCITIDGGNTVLRYWQVEAAQATGYIIESVTFGLREITVGNPEGEGTLTYPFEDFTLRLLRPVVPLGGGDTVQAADAATAQYPCAPAPESRLSIGMQAEMRSNGWMNYATYDDTFQFEGYGADQPLDEYGLTVMSEVMLRGLLLQPLIDPDSEDAIVIAAETVMAQPGLSPIVDVVGGPVCVNQNIYPLPTNQFDQPDRFMTYWQIEVSVNDTAYTGWYPENSLENVWFASEDPNIAIGGPALVTTYHLVPLGFSMDACPRPQLVAGQTVQVVANAINVRATPGGDVGGSISLGNTLPIFGEPICAGGVIWWQTNGGFVAETEPINGMSLLRPVQIDTVTQEPAQPEPVVTEEPAQPNPVVTEEPPSEPQPPAEQPPREPERPTEDPARAPERPTEEPPRPSAPIIAVTANPTTPTR